MPTSEISRRAFVASLAAASQLSAADDGWLPLFDGSSLKGWKASENKGTWKVVDGLLSNDGGRSHLFYEGPVKGADFRNFELEAEVMTKPGCNSGVYFHSTYQETGFPQKGFEVQVNNTATGEGSYRERKKTGSLYGVRNVYKQFVPDNEWFKLHISVRMKNVQVRLNGMLVVDYNEPNPPVIAEGSERGRFLDHGTFALQGHDPGSHAMYKSIRVRPLSDELPTTKIAYPPPDQTFVDIINYGAHNIPMVDFHVHLKLGLTLEQALQKSRQDGIMYGIAVNCGKGFPVQDDATARQFVESLKGQPVFVAMQAEGREWTQMFSSKTAALFDYVFTDSMTWTDNRGRRMRTWLPDEVGTIADPQEFMDTLVDRAVGIIDKEPVDIYVNPTFLPDAIAKDYASLWTEERMKKVVAALARNGVAMEINNRYKLPSALFVQMAKAAGVKFTMGTNNTGPADLLRCEYGLQIIKECKLGWQDFFVPGASGPKAVERKPNALKA
ncbi:DUF1080 domain-containing protein [Paludibaculum fermentans]|uniref:DUF1080 domain-containing protein n=1 Tax=Paludibaculum fermentans TaxID=1473598 RepID=A0A7S7NN80_PALFE|nr:family 16 glycoside hydrolase [Paludibaculum fermentans]QOY86644.1 DUF1080 domain-containing protein [Paludibaculum fermentans]